MARILILCSLLLALMNPVRAGADTIRLPVGDAILTIGPLVEYLEDPDGSLTIDAIRDDQTARDWQPSDQYAPSFGYTTSAYWIRFSLKPAAPRPLDYLLEIAYPVLDHVDVYVFQEGVQTQHHAMGDRQPYAQRPVDHPNFIVPLEISSRETTEVYVRVQSSSSIQIPLIIYSGNALVEHSYQEGISQALFYGAMITMMIYNLLIFLSLRDISYLYYVMVVVSITTLLAGIEGLTFKYLWPDASWINDPILVVALSAILFFSSLFYRSFLAIPETRPRFGRMLLIHAALAVCTATGAFIFPYRPMMLITIVFAMITIITGFWAGLVRWRDGYHAAKYFNLAWSFAMGACFLLALNKLGFMPRNWFTEHMTQIGASLQAVLLSFAMAHRMTSERRMRERAQLESAEAQQQLLAHQIRANQDLDRVVRERTEELEKTNSKLKEISATDGLTNLLNRRAFEELFRNEYKRAYREKSSIALLMIDLDHFKRINDQYGHPFGDLCLIKAAELVRASIRRPQDVAARYGGEEFILLLPNTDLEGAACIAQTLLANLAQTIVSDGQHQVFMTASIGAASQIPDNDSSREALLKTADLNLYAAKENGRNQVVWDHQPTEPNKGPA